MNTPQKVSTCLKFIDDRLESTSEQTIKIAEMIIHDIKELSENYPEAIKTNNLRAHTDKVKDTQMKWVNQLHEIILEQTNRDLNGQVIQALQKFITTMNQTQLKHLEFELPSAVAKLQPENEHEYLSQDEIEILLAATHKNHHSRTHH